MPSKSIVVLALAFGVIGLASPLAHGKLNHLASAADSSHLVSVKLEDFQKQLAGDSPVRRLLFSNYVAFPAVGAAFREASAR